MPNARFQFAVNGLSQELNVVRFAGHEGLSELFQFEVVVACDDPALSPDEAVDQPAVLTVDADEGGERFFHGIVARLRRGDSGKKLSHYQFTVVPKPWRLLHRTNCRIFQGKTAPEIVSAVLEGAGLATGDDFRLALQASYAAREYCVQWRESDWDFVCRLLEEEGIVYAFEHHADKHVLAFVDKPSAHAPIAGESTIVFRPQLGALASGEHVERFHVADDVRSGAVTLRDWNFKKPSLEMESAAQGSAHADLEVYEPLGRFDAPALGDAFAALRLEERAALRTVAEGGGAVARFTSGALFTLADHARDEWNREWLLVRVEHRGAEPTMMEAGGRDFVVYENHFRAIPSNVPFRPPHVTPRPTIRGVQSAIVTGPPGEEIHVDEHGRVKVQFHWDRLGKNDDASSCWLRVSQLWAGEGWGAMFIPRVGQEVIVDFFDGDPDRPIIVGRVYHGTNVPPYTLPANKTRSTIKSNSTPGGGGSNELRFEDKKGSEEVYLHGQKDWTIAIENDKNATVGHDETRNVGNSRTLEVAVDQSEKIGHDEKLEVGNDRQKTVGHDETEGIGHDRTVSVGNDHTESIGGNRTLSVAKGLTEDVGEDASETVGKSKALSTGKDYALDVKANLSQKVGSNLATEVELEHALKVGNKITITCGETKVTVEKSGDITVSGANLSIKTSGDVKLDAGGKVDVKATGDVKVEASGKVEVKSSGSVNLNASGAVKVKGTAIGIN